MLGVKGRRGARHLMARVNVLLPGLYAWLTTVAHPASQRGLGSAVQVTAYGALAALVIGVLLVPYFARWGRAFGVLGFVALCVATWILLDPLIDVQRLDPVRACCGAIAWALFAFGWGSAREETVGEAEEDDAASSGAPLAARSSLPRRRQSGFRPRPLGAHAPPRAAHFFLPQHCLYFFPLPQGHGSFRLGLASPRMVSTGGGRGVSSSPGSWLRRDSSRSRRLW